MLTGPARNCEEAERSLQRKVQQLEAEKEERVSVCVCVCSLGEGGVEHWDVDFMWGTNIRLSQDPPHYTGKFTNLLEGVI